MPPQVAPLQVDDRARLRGVGAQFLDDGGIIAVRHEADVLAVGLVRDRQAEFRGQSTGRGLVGQMA